MALSMISSRIASPPAPVYARWRAAIQGFLVKFSITRPSQELLIHSKAFLGSLRIFTASSSGTERVMMGSLPTRMSPSSRSSGDLEGSRLYPGWIYCSYPPRINGSFPGSILYYLVYTVKGSSADKQHCCINLNKFLMRMLASALRRNTGDGSLRF